MDYSIKIPETWDNSTIETYTTCPQKFEYRILRGLVPRVQARSLVFGTALHEALAAWYRTAKDDFEKVAKKLKRAIEELDPQGLLYAPLLPTDGKLTTFDIRQELAVLIGLKALPEITDAQAGDHRNFKLLEEIMRSYCNVYKHEPFEILHVEKGFAFFLDENTLYSGLMDLIIRWQGKIIIMDHKSTSSIFNFGENFSPNQQMSGYIAGMKASLADEVSNEACINAIQVSKRKAGIKPEDFQRFPNIHREDSQLEEFAENVLLIMADIRRDLERGRYEMRQSSCHHYGGCPFRPVCRVVPANREIVIQNFYDVKYWDPLEQKEQGLQKYSEG